MPVETLSIMLDRSITKCEKLINIFQIKRTLKLCRTFNDEKLVSGPQNAW